MVAAKAFSIKFEERFQGTDLQSYLSQLTGKLHRQALKRANSKAGAILAKEIRAQIKRRDMPYSQLRLKPKQRKHPPLARTIRTKAWSRPTKGIIGTVVGPMYPAGAHGHLVEWGHKITGHARVKFRAWSLKSIRNAFRHRSLGKLKTKQYKLGRRRVTRGGQRTIAHEFQSEAMDKTSQQIYYAMLAEVRAFIGKQGITVSKSWRL